MKREWKPGDVAVSVGHGYRGIFVARCTKHNAISVSHWHNESGEYDDRNDIRRRLVVIDPEDREQVERLRDLFDAEVQNGDPDPRDVTPGARGNAMQAALREFANPTPSEPTDATSRVSDRRDNIWRLLADGEWVCTSGPDIGEYLSWSGLVGRGPLNVEVTQ